MRTAERLDTTYAEYLAMERASDVRHQFIDGVAYAMAGGSPTHALLAMSIGAAWLALVRPGNGRCRVFSSDARIHHPVTGNSYDADVTVVSGTVETAAVDPDAIVNPTLVVEVLSESTERLDRGQKFAAYRLIPSLRHVVLVAQDTARLEHDRRNDDATWTLTVAEQGAVIHLPDLGGEVATHDVYRDVELTGSDAAGSTL